MKSALFIENLQVTLGKRKILDFKDKSISIEWGDKVALLGKNGAGKTTLINAILGRVPYIGNINKTFNNADIGIVFQNNEYSDLMKVKELINLVFNNHKNESYTYSQFCHAYNLENLQNKFIKDLSVGEKQRLTVGLVLSQQRNIYFLDELTSGLDYEKRESLRNLVHTKIKNATVIQVTHYFEEIENWANKVLILDDGELIYNGSLENLYRTYPHFSCIEVESTVTKRLSQQLLEKVAGIQNVANRFFVKNFDQQKSLTDTLSELDVSYRIQKRNVYTTYLLALEGKTHEKFDAKSKNAI